LFVLLQAHHSKAFCTSHSRRNQRKGQENELQRVQSPLEAAKGLGQIPEGQSLGPKVQGSRAGTFKRADGFQTISVRTLVSIL